MGALRIGHLDGVRSGSRRRHVRLRAAAVGCAIALVGILSPASASAALVSASDGNLAAFTGGISQVNGTLTAITGGYGSDSEGFAANYSGTGGGAASGSFQVH